MKKKVLILGASGMLGSAVYGVLKDKYDLILSFRDKSKKDLLEKEYGGVDKHRHVGFDVFLVYKDHPELFDHYKSDHNILTIIYY